MTPKNFILFQADSHVRDFIGCYGHPIIKTPNIDRVAAKGTLLSAAYAASPLFCPSRSAMATGRFPHETRYWDNSLTYDGKQRSWMHCLRKRSVKVESIGKLHFRCAKDDNGYSREIDPMHLVGETGGLIHQLRWSEEEPVQPFIAELWTHETQSSEGSDYQDYDRRITQHAIEWLEQIVREPTGEPWCLHVSYISPHPPFTAPRRFWEMYPLEDMPLPLHSHPDDWPMHPAWKHLRRTIGVKAAVMRDEHLLRKMTAGYFALISFMDEQLGMVLDKIEDLGLDQTTRIVYTSDHGDSNGTHGMVGNGHLLEEVSAVPLIVAGPDVPAGQVSHQIASHVDLFPTIVEAVGANLSDEDQTLPGISLWSAVGGSDDRERIGFAQYHAYASLRGSFMIRERKMKLIHHVGMPLQLFDLANDRHELNDLASEPAYRKTRERLLARLREIVSPEAIDRLAKEDQRMMVEKYGGNAVVKKMGGFRRSTPPGVEAEMMTVGV